MTDKELAKKLLPLMIPIIITGTLLGIGFLILTFNKSVQIDGDKVKLSDKEMAEGVLAGAPDRVKYDKYDYEHWGDCISATPKDGWKPMSFSQKYNNLEEGRTYGLILTFGKVLGVNDGVNIDEFRVTFVPTSSKGTADFTFYVNPEWVKEGSYSLYVELDDYK